MLYCWLRNATDGELSICAWGLGYCGSVHLEVQAGNDWVKLARVETPWRPLTGIGPATTDMRKLAAREMIGWNVRNSGGLADIRRYGWWQAPMTEVWLAKLLGSFRSERRFTYLEDLLDFVWPEKALETGKVSVRVVQSLAVPDSRLGFKWLAVTSPTVETDGQALKQMVEEANRLRPAMIADENRRYAQALDEAKRSRSQRIQSSTNSPAQKQ